jgi:hypothetical protein
LGRLDAAVSHKSGNLPLMGTGMQIPDHEQLVVPDGRWAQAPASCFVLPFTLPVKGIFFALGRAAHTVPVPPIKSNFY